MIKNLIYLDLINIIDDQVAFCSHFIYIFYCIDGLTDRFAMHTRYKKNYLTFRISCIKEKSHCI